MNLRPVLLVLAALPWLAAFTFPDPKPAPVSYARQIKPILKKNCFSCHNAEVQMGNLRMDTVEGMKKGGDTGKLYKAGKAADSLIVKRLLGQGGKDRMPLGKAPLTSAQTNLVKTWVNEGANLTN